MTLAAPWVAAAVEAFAAAGMQVVGVADGRSWEHLLPGCRSVLVVGNGGRALWEHALADAHPDPHPIDAAVARVIARLEPSPSRRWLRCAADEVEAPDFRRLGLEAGLGRPSRLGLLLHPTYGPWLGLRAACFTTDVLPVDGPLPGDWACEGCPAPCITACPAAAITDTWQADRCLPFRAADPTCEGGCLARSACVVGREHAFDALQHRYHHHPVGRADLLRALRSGDQSARR